MKIGIIGTGYVGLVTGACLAKVGNTVYCNDIDEDKINKLNSGKMPIYEEGLDEIIKDSLGKQKISFTTDFKYTLDNTDLIFLAVGTPMHEDGTTNLEYIMNVAREIGKNINEYKIIIIKSTVPIGTTKNIQKCIQKEINKREINIIFDVISNPEFLREGKAVSDFLKPDRVIIGLNNMNIKQTFIDLYSPFYEDKSQLIFMDIKSSELSKYASNAMLAMRISFINEMSQLCEKAGANINKVKLGIGSDSRIGDKFISPGIGFGGSCFPKDINSLKKQFESNGMKSLFSDAIIKINDSQRELFVDRIVSLFRKTNLEKNVTVWGITFKPNTEDIRDSQSIKIINNLLDRDFFINTYDPQGNENAKVYFKDKSNINFFNDQYEALRDSNALLLLTEWNQFRKPDFKKVKKLLSHPIIFDGRNVYQSQDVKMEEIDYFQIGVKNEELE